MSDFYKLYIYFSLLWCRENDDPQWQPLALAFFVPYTNRSHPTILRRNVNFLASSHTSFPWSVILFAPLSLLPLHIYTNVSVYMPHTHQNPLIAASLLLFRSSRRIEIT